LQKHREPPAGKLARGPAKPEDIERLRHELDETASPEIRAERKLDEVEAACQTIREDVDELKRVIAAEARVR
jgi:HAMP domain-containing protein